MTATILYSLGVLFTLAAAYPAMADWSVNAAGNLFYTDDVALFSATRRLDLHGDPTQPVLDTSLTGQGSDMVFEPDATVTKTFTSQWGRSDVSVRGQSFVYAVNPKFNHASVGVEMLHAFTENTKVRIRYFATPNLLLGDNESRRTDSIQEERVSSQIGSIRLEQRLSEAWEVRLLGRYGARTYNAAFAQRDTTLWTVGPHVVWHFRPGLAFVLGYHYERGLADGRNQPQFQDDVSYINHYVSVGLEAELTERLSLELGMHFERNIWTTGIPGDERNGGHEDVRQGELTLRYAMTSRWGALLGFQRSERKQSFEHEVVHNTNVSVGAFYLF
jgi:hypothetical protein